jgi:hypothetical protein
MKRLPQFALATFFVFAALAAVPSAWGWGCKGHEIVALIAEAHLTPHARATAFKILADGPISPTLSRYCKEPDLDAFVDSSTWADDERTLLPDTAPWHFIDIPRGAGESTISEYCLPATGCITAALANQLVILRDSNATAQARADALRFIIHFVGDIHQPLHDTTNNDRGGNCVPVSFFDNATKETNPTYESYNPNLHEVWDVEIIERFMDGQTPKQAADRIKARYEKSIVVELDRPADFMAWAWESHALAETIAYGRLPNPIPIEAPRSVETCADDDHVSTRLLKLNESLGDEYETYAEPVVQKQLLRSGIRLAVLLNSIWH